MPITDWAQLADVVMRGIAFLAASAGLLKAGIAGAKFFNKAGDVVIQIPAILEAQAKAQQEMVAAHNRQAEALEHSANLVPILESIQDERQQIGTTLRVLSREIREIKAVVTGDGKQSS